MLRLATRCVWLACLLSPGQLHICKHTAMCNSCSWHWLRKCRSSNLAKRGRGFCQAS